MLSKTTRNTWSNSPGIDHHFSTTADCSEKTFELSSFCMGSEIYSAFHRWPNLAIWTIAICLKRSTIWRSFESKSSTGDRRSFDSSGILGRLQRFAKEEMSWNKRWYLTRKLEQKTFQIRAGNLPPHFCHSLLSQHRFISDRQCDKSIYKYNWKIDSLGFRPACVWKTLRLRIMRSSCSGASWACRVMRQCPGARAHEPVNDHRPVLFDTPLCRHAAKNRHFYQWTGAARTGAGREMLDSSLCWSYQCVWLHSFFL